MSAAPDLRAFAQHVQRTFYLDNADKEEPFFNGLALLHSASQHWSSFDDDTNIVCPKIITELDVTPLDQRSGLLSLLQHFFGHTQWWDLSSFFKPRSDTANISFINPLIWAFRLDLTELLKTHRDQDIQFYLNIRSFAWKGSHEEWNLDDSSGQWAEIRDFADWIASWDVKIYPYEQIIEDMTTDALHNYTAQLLTDARYPGSLPHRVRLLCGLRVLDSLNTAWNADPNPIAACQHGEVNLHGLPLDHRRDLALLFQVIIDDGPWTEHDEVQVVIGEDGKKIEVSKVHCAIMLGVRGLAKGLRETRPMENIVRTELGRLELGKFWVVGASAKLPVTNLVQRLKQLCGSSE